MARFTDIAAGTVPGETVEAIRRRGCVVVQGTFPRQRAECHDGVRKPAQGAGAHGCDPEQVRQLPGGHLNADAGEESGQDGAGQEAREEAEPGQSRQQEQSAGEQRGEPGRLHVPCRARAARPMRAPASIAAVAESAADPRTVNTAIGRSSVYKPVTTGIPAILAYPRA